MKYSVLMALLIGFMSTSLLHAERPPQGSITIDRIADIKYPSAPAWSPDNTTVAFLWDAAGKQDLYMVKPGSAPVALTNFPVDPNTLRSDIGRFEWASPDEVLFSKSGQLWSVSTSNPRPSRLSGFEGVGVFTLSRDKKQIAFVRKGQIWVASLKWKTERQLTHLPEGLSVSGLSFSPDDKYVSFNSSHNEDVADPLPFNGDRVKVYRSVRWDTRLGIVSTFLGDPIWIPSSGESGGGGGGAQWVTGPGIVYQEFSPDRKTRTIKVTMVAGDTRTLWKDYDPAYWTPTSGARIVASPDGKLVAFVSDRSGWPHLYVIPSDATSESQAKQLSTGKFGDEYPSWSPDSKRIVYAHSEDGNQMERFISSVDVLSGKKEAIVTARGDNSEPSFSEDGSMVVYTRTAVEHPLEVYAIAAHPDAKPIRLTDSLPPGLQVADLTAPVPVFYPSRADDKKPVPATLIVNKNLDRKQNIRLSSGSTARERIRTISDGIPAHTVCTTP